MPTFTLLSPGFCLEVLSHKIKISVFRSFSHSISVLSCHVRNATVFPGGICWTVFGYKLRSGLGSLPSFQR